MMIETPAQRIERLNRQHLWLLVVVNLALAALCAAGLWYAAHR